MCVKHCLFCPEETCYNGKYRFLKSSNDELADYIKHIPDYLVIVMVEKDVDKRNKVYKAVDSVGYVCEMKPQTTATLENG